MPQGVAKVEAAAAQVGLNAINVWLVADGDRLEAEVSTRGAA